MSTKIRLGKVLIVDDNLNMAACLADMVEEFGVQSEVAENGEDAIKYLDEGSYSLIIADTQMPTVSGFTLLRYTKEKYPDIPVAMMSTRNSELTQKIIVKDRADFYLPKPFSTSDIADLLSKVAQK